MSAELPYRAHVDALLKHWSALTIFPPARQPKGPWVKQDPIFQRAWLLFNRWAENPLAQALQQAHPKWVRDRVTVPDGRADYAPFLLELPEELILSSPTQGGEALCDWLAQCLEVAAQQSQKRTIAQDLCGVVFSAYPARTVVRHCVALGAEHQPHANEPAVFNYHDARVMQRVWPNLTPEQQRQWLGPITRWWSIQQPWGPFVKSSDEPLPWFQANAPAPPRAVQDDAQGNGLTRNLLDDDQWFYAGSSFRANAIWRSYADNDVAPEAQPDPPMLMQLLKDAARLELKGEDLEDYMWITWLDSPEDGPPRAMDWSLPHTAAVLENIYESMQQNSSTTFLREMNKFVQLKQ